MFSEASVILSMGVCLLEGSVYGGVCLLGRGSTYQGVCLLGALSIAKSAYWDLPTIGVCLLGALSNGGLRIRGFCLLGVSAY